MLDVDLAEIYGEAEKTLYVIDNYIGVKTLALLKNSKEDVEIILFSDNVGRGLHRTEFNVIFNREKMMWNMCWYLSYPGLEEIRQQPFNKVIATEIMK